MYMCIYTPKPESGLDCLICAIFARKRCRASSRACGWASSRPPLSVRDLDLTVLFVT